MDESLAVTLQTTMTQLWAPVANIFNIFKLCGVLRDVCFTTYLSSFDANTCVRVISWGLSWDMKGNPWCR